jgi:hypothetical protein
MRKSVCTVVVFTVVVDMCNYYLLSDDISYGILPGLFSQQTLIDHKHNWKKYNQLLLKELWLIDLSILVSVIEFASV